MAADPTINDTPPRHRLPQRAGRFAAISALCLLAAACVPGGGTQLATVPHGQEYWDRLTGDQSEPRVDYPGPAIRANTGMGTDAGM